MEGKALWICRRGAFFTNVHPTRHVTPSGAAISALRILNATTAGAPPQEPLCSPSPGGPGPLASCVVLASSREWRRPRAGEVGWLPLLFPTMITPQLQCWRAPGLHLTLSVARQFSGYGKLHGCEGHHFYLLPLVTASHLTTRLILNNQVYLKPTRTNVRLHFR